MYFRANNRALSTCRNDLCEYPLRLVIIKNIPCGASLGRRSVEHRHV